MKHFSYATGFRFFVGVVLAACSLATTARAQSLVESTHEPQRLVSGARASSAKESQIPLDGLLQYGCSVNLGTDGFWLVHVWGDYTDGHPANSLATHGWMRLAAIRTSQKKALNDCNRFMSSVEDHIHPEKRQAQ